MGIVKELSPEIRAHIVGMRSAGATIPQIAQAHKVSISTVWRTLKRVEITGRVQSRARPGRPRILTDRMLHTVRRMVLNDPFISSAKIVADLNASGLRAPCARVIRRGLQTKLGLRSRRPAMKPMLTAEQRQRRIAFCKKVKDWTVEQWSKVLWSDESKFEQFGVRKRFVRRPVGKRFDSRYTIKTVKHAPWVMVWGCFSSTGRGMLYFLPKTATMNQHTYLAMLKEKVKIAMQVRNCRMFQQDGARCHTAKIVMRWFATNRIQVLEWPGNSADLNPIENLWEILKAKVAEKQPKSLDELIRYVKLCWCREITTELCARLVASMPQRIRYVLQHNGDPCPY